MAIAPQWCYGYLIGVLPALLILWVRGRMEEPVAWNRSESKHERKGSLIDLFADARWRGRRDRRTAAGRRRAVDVLGADRCRARSGRVGRQGQHGAQPGVAQQEGKFAYTVVQATGGGIGLLLFGPVCQWLGRKRAFVLVHLLGMAIVPVACYAPQSYGQLLWILPFYGAFTLAVHSGYAIYFPELFPTRAAGTRFERLFQRRAIGG